MNSLFAAAEDFSEMLEESSKSNKHGTLGEIFNKDKSSEKQLQWESNRLKQSDRFRKKSNQKRNRSQGKKRRGEAAGKMIEVGGKRKHKWASYRNYKMLNKHKLSWIILTYLSKILLAMWKKKLIK